jgi:integrase
VSLPKSKKLPDGRWVNRYSAPAGPDGKRRQPRVYGATEKECDANLVAALGKVSDGTHVDDRRAKLGEHLDRQVRLWESETAAGADDALKPRTVDSYRESVELYLRPGLGHLRLIDLRDHHVDELRAALRLINRPAAAQDSSDLLRRLLSARATRDGKRISTRPLSEPRITRISAVLSSALAGLVPDVLPRNPAARKPGKRRRVRKQRPLLWTAPRVERWQETGDVPAKVMVWTPTQCGAFLDAIDQERLYALFHLAAYYGARRNELASLTWPNTDLATRRVHIRGDVKSEDSERIIAIDDDDPAWTTTVLRSWHKAQLEERVAWGSAWTDSGHTFTRQDGTPLRPEWISTRFDTLAGRAGLPPITLHGLRHGAATMLLAAGQPPKVVSEVLGHSSVSFTMDVYTEVAEELAESAASAIAAFVPRKSKIVPARAKTVPNAAANDH